MLNNLYDNGNIINYLFYGIDMLSNLPAIDKVSAYKNKYNRLLKSKYNMILTISSISLLLNDLFEILEDKKYNEIIDITKIQYIKNIINIDSSRLSFNNIISYSFIEIQNCTPDDEYLINDIILKIKNKLPLLKELIYDDSYNDIKIMSIDFPTLSYNNDNIPDVYDYNIYVINCYTKLISDNSYYCNDDEINDNFNSVLDDILNNSHKMYDIKLCNMYANTLNGLFDASINNTDLINIYKILMRYINISNISKFIKLQYKLFKHLIINNNGYNRDMISKIYTFLSFDIIIYNKINNVNIDNITDILQTYNYYIIKLRDMIDFIFVPSKKRYFLDMYRSQLLKSRNKIRERMIV